MRAGEGLIFRSVFAVRRSEEFVVETAVLAQCLYVRLCAAAIHGGRNADGVYPYLKSILTIGQLTRNHTALSMKASMIILGRRTVPRIGEYGSPLGYLWRAVGTLSAHAVDL
jgi:hypothetical protein